MTVRRRTLLATGAAFAGGASAASGFDWTQFKGQQIVVFLQKSPRADLLQARQSEFEALTGVKVLAEQVPEQQHRQKFMIEFTSGRPSFDVVGVAPHVQKRLLGKTKWMLDLRALLQDSNATAPEFDYTDYAKSSADYATQPDGRVDMLMHNNDYNIVYYNKAMFAEKGVSYPASLSEMIETAKALHDPARGVAGFVVRGLKNANTSFWSAAMLGWDQYGIDPDLTVHTTSPEAVAAAELYQMLLRSYAPAGVSAFNWNECQTIFAQGRAAIWVDASGFGQPLEDPTKSRVVGKVGYGVIPPGPKAHYSGFSGDGLSIPAASRRQGAAWLYLQWACGKQMMARQLASGAGAPPRASAFQAVPTDPDKRVSQAWLDCVSASAPIARPHHPQIVAVTEYRDTFGIALSNMIGGANPASELAHATAQFLPVLERTEK